ncbi:unnamed protein product [Cuscuta europaea]|uniref:beta-fructofuranosidase n=1 Tax=Cuscuta europaea TaxID=41803 RepID=A0A9P0Z3W0_CUSEU|nr:unnamed protein product [Cuscuta europaea]
MASHSRDSSYAATPASPLLGDAAVRRRWSSTKTISVLVVGMLAVALLLVAAPDYKNAILNENKVASSLPHSAQSTTARGVFDGVSAKSNGHLLRQFTFSWDNQMLGWQRSAYHFQPQKNWMNGTNL